MAVQQPHQTVWFKPWTLQFEWRQFVPFRREESQTLVSLTGRVTLDSSSMCQGVIQTTFLITVVSIQNFLERFD